MNRMFAIGLVTCFSIPSLAKANCFEKAGEAYGIDPLLLYSIAQVESSLNPSAKQRNGSKSVDLGLMQINSSHLKTLQHFGVTQSKLLKDPCTNVYVGAWILKDSIRMFGPKWRAVGAYNAGVKPKAEDLRRVYAQRVNRRYQYNLKMLEHSRSAVAGREWAGVGSKGS